jgi:hypothetical protein
VKRVLYWIGLLTIAIPVLMPDVLALPFSSDGKVLAQGSAEQNPSLQQYERLDANEIKQLSTECRRLIAGEDDYAAPEGTKIYDCPNTSDKFGDCTVFLFPNGEIKKAICKAYIGISDPSNEKTPAPSNSRIPKKDRDSELAPPGKSQQPDPEDCSLLEDSPQGTKLYDCGDNLVIQRSDGSVEFLPLGNQQKDGDQQQDGGQQGGSDQGVGCAARR